MNSSDMDKLLRISKNMSMYLSTNPSAYEELIHKYIHCDVIYSKEFKDGTLYCVVHTNPSKNHRTLDNAVKLIESEIESGWVDSKFQFIGDYLSKKVKTFTAGEHLSDELYNAIFTSTTMGGRGERKVHSDVKIWLPPSNEVQPKAPKRKRVVAVVPNAGEERDGTADGSTAGMQQATLESKSQVMCVFVMNIQVTLSCCANSVCVGYHQRAQGAGDRSRTACESIRGQRG